MAERELVDARSPAYTPGVQRPANLKALTSVRFFAAMYVALFHMVRPYTRWGVLTGFFQNGYVGVSFFFLVSGFILTYSHAQEYERGLGRPSKFWVARFARIYPVYLLSMAYAAWFSRTEFTHKLHALAFVADLLVVQSWSVRMVNFFNVPAWTISVEAFFYLVFPFVVLRLRPRSAGRAAFTVGVYWLLAIALPVYALVRWPASAWTELGAPGPGGYFVFWLRRFPPVMLPEFLAGITLGWWYVKFRPSVRVTAMLAWGGAAATLVTLCLANHLPFILLHNGLLIPLFGALLLGLCQDNLLTRALSHPALVLLGEASFALYLFHFILNGEPIFGAAYTFRAAAEKLAIVIPLSILLHLYVERPCRRWILDWWRKRHPGQLALVAERQGS